MGYNQSELVLALVIDRNLLPFPRCYNLSVLDHQEWVCGNAKGTLKGLIHCYECISIFQQLVHPNEN